MDIIQENVNHTINETKHQTCDPALCSHHKNTNKNHKPPPPTKWVKNSQNGGKNPYRRPKPLKHR